MELGVPVQGVNKPGASGQIGLTDLTRAKPDGYTIA
jgi:tripartite-type tricarboxylate transporter receptor subunit TctC